LSKKIPWPRVFIEGAVIVGSILLAFGLQAWWEGHNEADREQGTLLALLAEFEGNEEELRRAISIERQHFVDAGRLLELMDREPSEIDGSEFDQLVRRLLTSETFHFESGAHGGLLSSGDMDVIRDENLRNHLAAWPSHVEEWAEEAESVFSLVAEVIVPYLSERWRLRDVGAEWAPFPVGEPPQRMPVGSSDAPSRALLSAAVEFENLVFIRSQGAWYAIRDGEGLQAELSTILRLIRQNIDE